ncbi:hypothetical protein BDS110ZK25_24890 [Bradyrhizobium diazoefficiens]|uniref:Uncharacterized protein n=1 Tax=Bradyrhizobium diazoefficiens TaxID=1355477 RepID=A0A809ZF72_9BRAD|nr:hypothetical protein BD122_21880 [Bradyrhizobium diazoefficiens]BCE22794.1 hypothetical protein XF1B_54750 [Bradyrhizobium diazoefficiens]BCE49058.1 hypothetical protein XF4B_54070 [Bradyrhizobium diazoefficiens]BCE74317.1 hypothetical protein XF8B_44280 [Bradyrhizobium diazoefficiens]BCE92570.1 hypothetical protein XF10B_53680 [Bradyrhizobium diazoefficiens]
MVGRAMHRDGTGARLANASAQTPPRIDRERGVGDLQDRRTRRARMSSGPGGIARELIDLPLEDQRSSGQQNKGMVELRPVGTSICAASTCRALARPHHL